MDGVNWKKLKELRSAYINENKKLFSDYWHDLGYLEVYDQTLAKRISWKWDYVLQQDFMKAYDFSSYSKLLDWGCGTGIASRQLLKNYEDTLSHLEFMFYDRSELASSFALKKIQEETNQPLKVKSLSRIPKDLSIDILLISHVLNELTDSDLNQLRILINKAKLIIWVEPGTYEISKRLTLLRNELLEQFNAVLPCPHDVECPLADSSKDWCHFFAPAPQEIFHSAFWSKFKIEMKIDIKTIPLSYLVLLDKKEDIEYARVSPRFIAKPKKLKFKTEQLACMSNGNISFLENAD